MPDLLWPLWLHSTHVGTQDEACVRLRRWLVDFSQLFTISIGSVVEEDAVSACQVHTECTRAEFHLMALVYCVVRAMGRHSTAPLLEALCCTIECACMLNSDTPALTVLHADVSDGIDGDAITATAYSDTTKKARIVRRCCALGVVYKLVSWPFKLHRVWPGSVVTGLCGAVGVGARSSSATFRNVCRLRASTGSSA
jgi:hypothetical protein